MRRGVGVAQQQLFIIGTVTGQSDAFPTVRELSFMYTDEAREGCRQQLLNQHTQRRAHTNPAGHGRI